MTPKEPGAVLTVEELSRRVAEHIEPLRTVVAGMQPEWLIHGQISPEKCWSWQFTNQSPACIEWQPRNMLEPEMSVLLQARLLRDAYTWSLTEWDDEHERYTHIEMDGLDSTRRWPIDDYPLAVLHAYALAFGLATEEELKA